jgi:pyruvoyl-dependent arginine decarboxylase (PvlArgDC)
MDHYMKRYTFPHPHNNENLTKNMVNTYALGKFRNGEIMKTTMARWRNTNDGAKVKSRAYMMSSPKKNLIVYIHGLLKFVHEMKRCNKIRRWPK